MILLTVLRDGLKPFYSFIFTLETKSKTQLEIKMIWLLN